MTLNHIKDALAREASRRTGKAALAGCLGGPSGQGSGSMVECATGVVYDGSMKTGDLCSFNRLPASVTVAGQASAVVQIEPQNSPWFVPLGIAAKAVDSSDNNLDRSLSVRITDVSVQRCPELDFSDPAPTAATTQFMLVREWDPDARDGCACRVDWDAFSNLANTFPLRITVFNNGPAGSSALVVFDVIGEAVVTCYPKRKPGSRGNRMGVGSSSIPA